MNNKITKYILKHNQKRNDELKYDFMPSLLEIIERPAHAAGTIIIFGIFTLLIAVVIWACLAEIDVIITSSGNIQPIGNLNIVQSYAGGSVKSINVSEGDYVEQGDVLVELDTKTLEIDENQLNKQKNILETQSEVYKSIINDEDISTFNSNDYDDEIMPYIQTILDSNQNYKNMLLSLENEKNSAELTYQLAQLQLETYRENGIEGQTFTQMLVAVRQREIEVEQINLQISDTKTQYSAQINSSLADVYNQLGQIAAELEQYELSKKYQQLTAPVSGYVNSVNVNTIGETVTSSQEIVSIVAVNAPLEMVCYVKNMDIADINMGMEVEIKFEAYPYNKYGTAKGKIKYISPSAFSSEEMGSVYVVKVDVTEKNEEIEIISGLSGNVEIKTGKRTVMDYFLEPIMNGFGESLKEK